MNWTDQAILSKGAELLCDAMNINTTIVSLGLQGESQLLLYENSKRVNIHGSGNDLGVKGATIISKMLKVNTTLTELDLSRSVQTWYDD